MSDSYLILGDVHIGKGQNLGKALSGDISNSRLQDQIGLLDWTLEQAIEREASTIFCTGDMFEMSRPYPNHIKALMIWLKKCERYNISFHCLAGNHDIIRAGLTSTSALDLIPALELTHANVYKDPATLNFDGISFTLLPYRDRRIFNADSPQEALELLKKEHDQAFSLANKNNIKVGILHLAIEGAMFVGDESDNLLNEIFCPLDMFSKYDYVWAGHVHIPQVFSKIPHIAHIGSMDRSDFHDAEMDHEKILIHVTPGKEQFFTEIPIPTRALRKIVIDIPNNKDSTDFAVNHLHSLSKTIDFKGSIIRLNIKLEGSATLNVDREKVSNFLYNQLEVHNIANFFENRSVQVTSKETETYFDNQMSVPSAVDSFSKTIQFEEELDREEYIKLSIECLDELKLKKK